VFKELVGLPFLQRLHIHFIHFQLPVPATGVKVSRVRGETLKQERGKERISSTYQFRFD
jgi:hypothetical protein